ncbi:MAG TPA: acyl carrier protein [Verrucomicrobiae bacterium]|nr:acyl carrier protein [Verrucomicrobiae bacterium]
MTRAVEGDCDPRSAIRAFLRRFIAQPIGDGDDIFNLGHVDSLFAIQLVLFLEREFAIKVENRDLDLDNFRSVEMMAAFIGKKRGVAH